MTGLSKAEDNAVPSFRPLAQLLPYLWPAGRRDLKTRVVFSLLCLTLAKVATVILPIFFGKAVDALSGAALALAVPLGLIAAYTLARIAMQGFAQIRDGIFADVAYHALREVGVRTFAHVHTLSLRFHVERKTGALARTIERGTRGIDILLSLAIFSIFPVALELILIGAIMLYRFDVWFAAATMAMVALYGWLTLAITNWRIKFRRRMIDSDTEAGAKTVDSLLNYETVKYFNNEVHETGRFDEAMGRFCAASIKSQTSLSVLNTVQAVVIALGLAAVMTLAAFGIKDGKLTVGDFVMVNAYLVQLYVPLNLLGMVYREVTQALVDMDALFSLLHREQEVRDASDAKPLQVAGGEIRFADVVFAYDPARPVLKGISFTVPAGKTVAVVGPSGAGKSTLSRILYRFYDIQSGAVTIDGQDIAKVRQDSLRAAIGIVPQDTVLFNDTIRYNIAYGRIGADDDEIAQAAAAAQIDAFIRSLPQGYDSLVGERGLKLSGGEKQRVAIARTILKDPPILVLDEATSALDTHTEREIQGALNTIAKTRTTLIIAHRLSTVVDADEILVLDHGRIVERGRHGELLALNGAYAAMWNKQKQADAARETLAEAELDPDVSPTVAHLAPSPS